MGASLPGQMALARPVSSQQPNLPCYSSNLKMTTLMTQSTANEPFIMIHSFEMAALRNLIARGSLEIHDSGFGRTSASAQPMRTASSSNCLQSKRPDAHGLAMITERSTGPVGTARLPLWFFSHEPALSNTQSTQPQADAAAMFHMMALQTRALVYQQKLSSAAIMPERHQNVMLAGSSQSSSASSFPYKSSSLDRLLSHSNMLYLTDVGCLKFSQSLKF